MATFGQPTRSAPILSALTLTITGTPAAPKITLTDGQGVKISFPAGKFDRVNRRMALLAASLRPVEGELPVMKLPRPDNLLAGFDDSIKRVSIDSAVADDAALTKLQADIDSALTDAAAEQIEVVDPFRFVRVADGEIEINAPGGMSLSQAQRLRDEITRAIPIRDAQRAALPPDPADLPDIPSPIDENP